MQTKEQIAAYHKKYRAENPEKRAAWSRKWLADNKERRAAINKVFHKRGMENLSDCYVSDSFAKRKNSPYTGKELRQFPDIIETLRLIMKIKRLCIIKNKENENS